MSDDQKNTVKLALSEAEVNKCEEQEQQEFFDKHLRDGLDQAIEAGTKSHTVYRALIRAAIIVSIDAHGENGFDILEEAVEFYVHKNKERYAKGWR